MASIKKLLLRVIRPIGKHFPGLMIFAGKLNLRRLVWDNGSREVRLIDGDVTVEFDLSIPSHRHFYFTYDLTSAPETYLIKHLGTSDGAFIDVGANIGYFTLVAAKYNGHVIAFEPSSHAYVGLQHNLQLNPGLASKVTCYQLGLFNEVGDASLFNCAENPGMASLKPFLPQHTKVETVRLARMDDLLGDTPIHFIKVDVEGAEFDVLLGAQNILRRCRPVVLCELFESYQQRFGHNCQEIIDLFSDMDYVGVHIEENLAAAPLRALDLALLSDELVNTALFIPKERYDETILRISAGT